MLAQTTILVFQIHPMATFPRLLVNAMHVGMHRCLFLTMHWRDSETNCFLFNYQYFHNRGEYLYTILSIYNPLNEWYLHADRHSTSTSVPPLLTAAVSSLNRWISKLNCNESKWRMNIKIHEWMFGFLSGLHNLHIGMRNESHAFSLHSQINSASKDHFICISKNTPDSCKLLTDFFAWENNYSIKINLNADTKSKFTCQRNF